MRRKGNGAKVTDELNYGYLSHNKLVYTFYRFVDFLGYRLFKREPISINARRLLFINLGLIGDLIIFRYVIDAFLRLPYNITLLIRDEYKFLFANLSSNVKVITVKGYKEKKFLSGLIKIRRCLRQTRQEYDIALHFRGYLGNGILSTYLARVAKYQVGYPTSGFGFLLNHKLDWKVGQHESQHLMNLLHIIQPNYKLIALSCYTNYITRSVLKRHKLDEKSYVIIHATSQNAAKNIPVSVLKATIDYFLNHAGLYVVFVGVKGEDTYVKECLNDLRTKHLPRVKLIFTESFFHVYSLIAYAKLFIGVDSSLAHISSGLSLPKIIYWHKLNLFNQWHPLGSNFYVLNNVEEGAMVNDTIIADTIIKERLIHAD